MVLAENLKTLTLAGEIACSTPIIAPSVTTLHLDGFMLFPDTWTGLPSLQQLHITPRNDFAHYRVTTLTRLATQCKQLRNISLMVNMPPCATMGLVHGVALWKHMRQIIARRPLTGHRLYKALQWKVQDYAMADDSGWVSVRLFV